MFCKKCGHPLEPDAKVCPNCGRSLDDPGKSVRWISVAIVVAALLLVLVLVLIGILVAKVWLGEPDEVLPEEAVEQLLEDLNQQQQQWTDDNGYVPEEDLEECLEEAYQVLEDTEIVTYCEKNEENVYFECEDGFGYVYMPEQEAYASGGETLKISTIQPAFKERLDVPGTYDYDAPDSAAQQISDKYDLWSFENSDSESDDNLDDEELTVERMLEIYYYKLILWHGHGGYTKSRGFYAASSIKATEQVKKTYKWFLDRKYILISTEKQNICFTEEFFRSGFYDNAFDGAVIYMGTCCSGKTKDFAQILLDKGAAAVYVNSGIISRSYNLKMIRAVGENLCRGDTITQALENAQLQHGASKLTEWGTVSVYCMAADWAKDMTLDQLAERLLPEPEPDAPAPEDPAPDAPAPEDPAPDAPAPDAPAPDAPAPDTPAPDTPAPDAPAPDTTPEYVTAYTQLLQEQVPTMGGSDISQYYTLYDIDLDGVPECLIEQGWGDDYRTCDVYTTQGPWAVYLGSFHTNYSTLYGDVSGGLTVMSGQDGTETCRKIYHEGGTISESVLYMVEVDQYWDELCDVRPLKMYKLNDSEGLNWRENPNYDNWAALEPDRARVFP